MKDEWQSLPPEIRQEIKNVADSAEPLRSVEEVKAMLETTEKGGFHAFDEPKQWEIREINEIMNQCVTGWNYFSNLRMFAGYGRQKGWEREQKA